MDSEDYERDDVNYDEWADCDLVTCRNFCWLALGFDPIKFYDSTYAPYKRLYELAETAALHGFIANARTGYDWKDTLPAPLMSWVKWALTKKTISVDSRLLESLGLKKASPKSRPFDETLVKECFVRMIKILLEQDPKLTWAKINKNTHIRQLFIDFRTYEKRCLSGWLAAAGVHLLPGKRSRKSTSDT